MGFLVEALRHRGVEAGGVDVSSYAISKVAPEIQEYCWMGSVKDPFPRKYDLIVSIEILEHLPIEASEEEVSNLCRYNDDVLFSSTPNDYKEASHFNVQPPEYQAELFALESFYRDVDFNAIFITPWAVRFRKKSEPLHRIVHDYERKIWLLYKEKSDLRNLTQEMREILGESESKDFQEDNQFKGRIRRWIRRLRG